MSLEGDSDAVDVSVKEVVIGIIIVSVVVDIVLQWC